MNATRDLRLVIFTIMGLFFGWVHDARATNEIEPCDAGNGFSCGCVRENSLQVAATPPGTGVKRILLYRVDFSDAVGAAIASNDAVTLIAGLNTYYSDMSYGSMNISLVGAGSVVTETLRLPEPSTAYDNNFIKFINATRQTATAAGYTPAAFDFDIVCTGTKPFLVFGALAFVGGPGLWVGNNNFTIGVVGHELGHNLGLPHASFWFTGDQSSIGPGRLEEFGDPFDAMGFPGTSTSHFNVRFKNYLGWIPDSDAPVVLANGTYRLTAQDHPSAQGVRALQVPRSPLQSYWLEFRQFFNNRSVTNGVTLRWGTTNIFDNTLLLDTTPGTPQGKQDPSILVGRTFSDRCIDVHITPVAKVGTTPDALDVVINRGPFPGNVPPTIAVSASATDVSVGSPVTLQAVASDPNGDTLAYFWDFGDAANYGPNQPTVQFAWTRDGEYVVRCTASDMKGGAASASVVVRVGTVTTFAIEGTVERDGAPVEGALVKAGSRFTYSNSDGTYRLTRLAAGRQIIQGVLDGFNLVNAGFENPVTVGPNASGANLVALPEHWNALTLISTGAVWKYLDTGITPAASWTSSAYDDSGWSSGRAKLGYGVGDERTVVSFGTNTSSRHITTWFRNVFTIADTTGVDHITFRLRRDDGVVVHLNGAEIYRENMPPGPVLNTTTASADVNFNEEPFLFKRVFPGSLLLAGTNVVAVEVHQFDGASPDLSFDLELLALSEDGDQFRPPLELVRTNSAFHVRWPATYAGWNLYSAQTLETPLPWPPAAGQVTISNNSNSVLIGATNAMRFFHLRKPVFCSP
jgi:hypothetical protein